MKGVREGQFCTAWAEPVEGQVSELLARSRRMPWYLAIDWLRTQHASFAARLDREWLSDWTLLVHPSPGRRALDLGCGFGTLTLGLARRFASVAGVDALPLRLRVAATRARALGVEHVVFVQADGHQLPLSRGVFDLAVLNGVLEWAALGCGEKTADAQVQLLAEVRRMLDDDGVIGVAIENRFALETWNLTKDTHTGMLLIPVLPRWLGSALYRIRQRRRLAVQLHSRRGYQRLFRRAGFSDVRVLDVAPSYNDYDVVIDPDDAATYRFLWRRGLLRGFNPTSHSIRRRISGLLPSLLGRLSYAYLVIAGRTVITLLDAAHPLWAALRPYGISPGTYRFGSRVGSVGQFAIVAHDGENVSAIVAVGAVLRDQAGLVPLPDSIRGVASSADFSLRADVVFNGTPIQAWLRLSDLP